MSDVFSTQNLERAFRYTLIDVRDNFTYDIINHQDLKHNRDRLLRSLKSQLEHGQYYPAPVLHTDIPKNPYSVRPGTTVAVVDSVVLYAIIQQLAPKLDQLLPPSAYAYRLNPNRSKSGKHLFDEKPKPEPEQAEGRDDPSEEIDSEVGFPYGWFSNWLEFHERTQEAAQAYEFVAVSDISAYFENISLEILFDRLRGYLEDDDRELKNQLEELLRYWDWSSADSKVRGRGLPQGNDVSSFLSNIYLLDLDRAMLDVVQQDGTKYHRYVDDIQIYTSDYDEARQALIELERVLRKLGLNSQSAKTKILPAGDYFDVETGQWEKRLADDASERYSDARLFFSEIYSAEDPKVKKRWERIYRRALTVLRQGEDDSAVPIALELFLSDPSYKELKGNFLYLKHFIASFAFEAEIYRALEEKKYLFDYHKAYLFRLAAYSRREDQSLKDKAMSVASSDNSHWFVRVAALHFLTSCALQGRELAEVGKLTQTESNPQVIRASFIALGQHSGEELDVVLDSMTFFNAPHQEYLQRYFYQMVRNEHEGKKACANIKKQKVDHPDFISYLHQLDLLKANRKCRGEFDELIGQKIEECSDSWPRLRTRLEAIRQEFVRN